MENGIELSLTNAIDRFEDVRHIFNLCEVKAQGFYKYQEVKKLIFGEYQLFRNLNERRAALSSPVIIDLNILQNAHVSWDDVKRELIKRHFKEVPESPARRGQFRQYIDHANQQSVEIFFPHNVYPVGVLGLQEPQGEKREGIVCLSSGGLSGRVGNTIEGTTRIMFDFFGCTDALVLDEGLDVFFIANTDSNGKCKYSNEVLLNKILSFTKETIDNDHKDSIDPKKCDVAARGAQYSEGMKCFPLNKMMFEEIDNEYKKLHEDILIGKRERNEMDYKDVLLVKPGRAQIRSVLIFARKRQARNASEFQE